MRQLVSPYILRRLKSDKRIISDLPDKTEIQTYCTLTKQQVSLISTNSERAGHDKLEQQVDGIQRNRVGVVLFATFQTNL